jgi:hypothetical protein
MADSNDVYGALVNTGNTLKADLWQADDLKTLKMIAGDMVGLNAKMLLATTPDDKQRYVESLMRLVDHSALLALSRLNVATNDILTALKNFFLKLIGQWQPHLLPAFNNQLPGISMPAANPAGTGTGATSTTTSTSTTTPAGTTNTGGTTTPPANS